MTKEERGMKIGGTDSKTDGLVAFGYDLEEVYRRRKETEVS